MRYIFLLLISLLTAPLPIMAEEFVWPEGFKNASSELKQVWKAIKQGEGVDAHFRLGLSSAMSPGNTLSKKDRQNAPATYFSLAFIYPGDKPGIMAGDQNYGGLSVNDPMQYWAIGIGHYVKFRVEEKNNAVADGAYQKNYDEIQARELIEVPLLKAILLSAEPGKSEQRLHVYLTASLQKKERLLTDVMLDLDKATRRNQLVAAWAATWLANYYLKYDDKGQWDIGYAVNRALEVPLNKYVGRIRSHRGGPYYYDSQGHFKA